MKVTTPERIRHRAAKVKKKLAVARAIERFVNKDTMTHYTLRAAGTILIGKPIEEEN